MKKALIAIATASLFCASIGAQAMTKDEYKAAKDQAEATYKTDKKACDGMKDNAKDICVSEAKGKEKVAKAEADAAYKNTPKAREAARIAHADATYNVAKEKCDDLAGDAKNTCVKDAKAARATAKADSKVS